PQLRVAAAAPLYGIHDFISTCVHDLLRLCRGSNKGRVHRAPCYSSPALSTCPIQSGSQLVKSGCRAAPSQLVHILEKTDVGPKRGESSIEHGAIPLAARSLSGLKMITRPTRISAADASAAAARAS